MFTSSDDGNDAASAQDASDDAASAASAASIETIPNSDIDRVIDDVIREHGANAAIEAATRTISTLDEGAVRVRLLWQRVLEAAMEAQRENCGQSGASAGAHS
jgi:hypothetical protein